jgi:hypothetical protein
MNSLKRIGISCIAAIAITAAGCGEVTLSPDAATPDTGPLPTGPCEGDVALDDAWQCLVEEACRVVSECFGGVLSVDQCLELDLQLMGLSGRYGDILLQGAIAQGRLTYETVAMGECLDTMRQMTCQDVFGSSDPFALCRPFKGTIVNDSVCYFNLECATLGAECQATNCDGQICCPGTCVAPAPVGSACVGRPCVPGAHCVNDACTSGVANDPCRYSSDCDTDHWCDPQGLCQPDVATGEACISNDQCTLPALCVGDVAGAPGACALASEVGDACDDSCFPFASLYCNRPDATVLGTCAARLGEGDTCDPERGQCQFGLRCDSSLRVCIPGQQLNQVCDSGLPCDFYSGLHCTNEIDDTATGICQGPQPTDRACRYGAHCLSGYCYQDVCTDVVACY